MKKKSVILTLAVAAQLSLVVMAQTKPVSGQSRDSNPLVGSWSIGNWAERDKTKNFNEGTITFTVEGTVLIINGNDTIKGAYTSNMLKNPHWIDINLKTQQGDGSIHGIMNWIDNNTARLNMVPKSKMRPATFEDDPDLDGSNYLKRQLNAEQKRNEHSVKAFLTMHKWNVMYLYDANKYSPGNDKKYQKITFNEDNTYQIEGTAFILGSSGKGRYEINPGRNLDPYWIDLIPDGGERMQGLIKDYMQGYKLEFPLNLEGERPVQFSDVVLGDPNVINFNPRFFYLHPYLSDAEESKKEIAPQNSGPITNSSRPGENITDIQGNTYKTIILGNGQQWMAENLRYLPSIAETIYVSDSIPYYYVYGYKGSNISDAKSTANYQTYGVLYNWSAAICSCPEGWHLPAQEEWQLMEDYFISQGNNYDGSTSGDKLAKSLAAESMWSSSTKEGSIGNSDYSGKRNVTGFNALPAGTFHPTDFEFINIGKQGVWWTKSEKNSQSAYYRLLAYHLPGVFKASFAKASGYSVRCVKD